MSEKRFTVKSIKNNHYQIAENDLKMLSNEVVDYMNLSSDAIGSLQKKVVEQKSFISELLVENEEYEKESEEMQTKINVLYHEAKKHMSSTEWKKFNRRIIETEEELGIKWVRL